MTIIRTFGEPLMCSALFVLFMVSIQINHYILLGLWLLCSIISFITFNKKSIKSFVVTQLCFGIGFFIYLSIHSHEIFQMETKELSVFLNRLSLVLVLLPMGILSFFSRSLFMTYWKKPQWNEYIHFPFIWSGFHKVKVKFFLFIALMVNLLIFIPFILSNDAFLRKDIWILALVFSLTNAILEEFIWRGVLLSRYSEQLGEKWGVILTSIGFGLQHYSLGFPWNVCLAFSIGGLFYGGITIKSKSIFPSILWHIILNIFMVLSGLILK